MKRKIYCLVWLICMLVSTSSAQDGEDIFQKHAQEEAERIKNLFPSFSGKPKKKTKTQPSNKVKEREIAELQKEIEELDSRIGEIQEEKTVEEAAHHQEEMDRIVAGEKVSKSASKKPNRDSLRIVNKYLPYLVKAFDYTDAEEISHILDRLLEEKYVPSVLTDTVRNYAIATGLATPARRGFLRPVPGVTETFVQVVDKVNFFGDYGVLPGWELYGDSVAIKNGQAWQIRGKIHPAYYADARKNVSFPQRLPLVDSQFGYSPAIKVSDMSQVYDPFSRKRYHPSKKQFCFHGGNDCHTHDRKTEDPEDIHVEYYCVVRVMKNDPYAGLSVALRNFNGTESVSKHLSSFADIVPGDTLYPGDVIGKIGKTGKYCTGEHLCHRLQFLDIAINTLYLVNWTDYVRVPDKNGKPQDYIRALELKKELAEWHKGVAPGELCSTEIIIHEPGSAKVNKNVLLCKASERCEIEIPGRSVGQAQTLGEVFQASKP
jgi:hypothetical protein